MVNGRQFVNRINAIVLSNLTSLYVYNSSGCLVWRDRGANPRSTAPEADALTTRLSGQVKRGILFGKSWGKSVLIVTVQS